jgi:hypothetical protein
MAILRLLFFATGLILLLSAGLYGYTHNPRYLRFAWQTARFALFSALVFAALYVLERYVLIGWRVLL